MVGTKKHVSVSVFHSRRHHLDLRHISKPELSEQMVHSIIPFSCFLHIHIAVSIRHHPVVSVMVNIYTVVHDISRLSLLYVVAHPDHFSLVAVESGNHSVFQYYHRVFPVRVKRRQSGIGSILCVVHYKARLDILAWIVVVKLSSPNLYPVVLSFVYIYLFHGTFHSCPVQPWREVLLKLLGLWVIYTVFQFLLYPNFSVYVLKEVINIIAEQRRTVLYVGMELPEAVSVISVQSILRTNPHKAFRVLKNAVYL